MRQFEPRQRRLLALGTFLFVISFLVVTGLANAAGCGKRPDVVEALRKQHGEQPAQIALAADGRVVELWSNPKGGWTLLATHPNGYACILAAGREPWESLPLGEPV